MINRTYTISSEAKETISEAVATLTILSKIFSIEGEGLEKGIVFNGDQVYAMNFTLSKLVNNLSKIERKVEEIDVQ